MVLSMHHLPKYIQETNISEITKWPTNRNVLYLIKIFIENLYEITK